VTQIGSLSQGKPKVNAYPELFVHPELETLKKSQNKEFYSMKLLFLNMSDALKRTGMFLVFLNIRGRTLVNS
jgi:hypothetical protein